MVTPKGAVLAQFFGEGLSDHRIPKAKSGAIIRCSIDQTFRWTRKYIRWVNRIMEYRGSTYTSRSQCKITIAIFYNRNDWMKTTMVITDGSRVDVGSDNIAQMSSSRLWRHRGFQRALNAEHLKVASQMAIRRALPSSPSLGIYKIVPLTHHFHFFHLQRLVPHWRVRSAFQRWSLLGKSEAAIKTWVIFSRAMLCFLGFVAIDGM